MTEDAKKHLIFFVAWLLCMGYILILQFSWIALAAMLILGGISLYRNVLRKGDVIHEYLTLNMRYYILVTAIYIECVYAARHLEGFAPDRMGAHFTYIFERTMEMFTEFVVNNIVYVLIYLVFSLAWAIIRKKVEAHAVLHTIVSYQFLVAVFAMTFYAATGNADIVILHIVLSLIYMMGDVIRKTYDKAEALGPKAGVVGFIFLNLAAVLVLLLNADIYVKFMEFTFESFVVFLGRWDVLLVPFILTLAVLVLVSILNSELALGWAYEKYMLLTILSVMPVVFTMSRFYSGYRYIMLIAYFVFVLINVTRSGPRANDGEWYYSLTRYLTMPAVSIAVSVVFIGAHYGKILIMGVLFVSTFIMIAQLKKIAGSKNSDKNLMAGMITVILWLYVNTMARLWTVHRHISPMIVMSVAVAVFVVILVVINHNPNIYEENIFQRLGQFVLPVLFLIVALLAPLRGGSHVEITESDDGYINIELSADGDENSVLRAEYVWLNDWDEIASDLIQNGEVEPTMFGSSRRVKAEDGLLKIVVEDQYGVKTTYKVWYHVEDAELVEE